MIIEVKRTQKPELFESYDELFVHLNRLENLKILAPNPDFTAMNWSFTLYSAERVCLLFEHLREQALPVKEAHEQSLPLIEICTGDFALPEYVVKTPTLNMGYLKRKWSLDYCACHGMSVTEKD